MVEEVFVCGEIVGVMSPDHVLDHIRDERNLSKMINMLVKIMAFRQIPTMTKSHHGGNMSLIGEVGFCHRHIPTIDNHNDEVGLGGMVDQLRFVKV